MELPWFYIKPLIFFLQVVEYEVIPGDFSYFQNYLSRVLVFFISVSTNYMLTHWGRVTHICVSRLTITGSDNGLSPGWRQAIIWTNAGILLIVPLGTNFSENLIEILTFSFTKMRLKVSSAKWRPFCLGLNVLKYSKYLEGIKHKVINVIWYCVCKSDYVDTKFISKNQIPLYLVSFISAAANQKSWVAKQTIHLVRWVVRTNFELSDIKTLCWQQGS